MKNLLLVLVISSLLISCSNKFVETSHENIVGMNSSSTFKGHFYVGSDKTHHFIAYGALMFPTALRKPNYWLLIGVFFVFWSGGIELIQPHVNRYGEWLDLAANIAGIGCGLLVAILINWIIPVDLKTR